jgi:hypothetical protein
MNEYRRASTHQSVAYTGTAGTISSAVGAQTYCVRIVVTTAAYVKIGDSPTATSSDMYVAPSREEYFTCSPGQKVSAIQVASGGSLHVTEMTG